MLTHGASAAIGGATTPSTVDIVRGMRSSIRERSDSMEQRGRLDDDLVAAIASAGVHLMMCPTAVGGEEAEPSAVVEVLRELSYADGSLGWVAMVAIACTGIAGAYFSDPAVEEIFDGPRGVSQMVVGTLQVAGRAERVRGGYRVSGRFGFASGSHHAAWLLACLQLYDGATPLKLPDGTPRLVLVAVPRTGVVLLGNWDVMGLKATASYDCEIADQVLGSDFVVELTGIAPRRGLGFVRLGPTLAGVLGHAAFPLGVAQRALDELATLIARKRQASPNGGALPGSESLERDYGRATASLHAASAYVIESFSQRYAAAGGAVAASVECRLAAAHAVNVAVEVAQFAYRSAGTAAVRNGNDIQRCFRDINAAAQHFLTADPTFLQAGSTLLRGGDGASVPRDASPPSAASPPTA